MISGMEQPAHIKVSGALEGEFIITEERSANEFVITRDTSWQAMLGKDERDATEEEIAALEAEHGPFPARRRRGVVLVYPAGSCPRPLQ